MLELIIVFIIGLIVGGKVASAYHLQGFKQILRDLDVSNEDLIRAVRKSAGPDLTAALDELEHNTVEKSTAVIEVKLEQHSGQIYAFRKSDDKFLGQGHDPDSLIKRLNETMTPCRVIVAKEDGADLLQKNNT